MFYWIKRSMDGEKSDWYTERNQIVTMLRTILK